MSKRKKPPEQKPLVCPPRRPVPPGSSPELEAAAAGLPDSSEAINCELRQEGIDPERLSIFHFGRPGDLWRYPYPPCRSWW